MIIATSILVAQSLGAYELTPLRSTQAATPSLEALRKISEGISDLAVLSSRALVFVSVSRTAAAPPQDEMQPFNYHFDPKKPEENEAEPPRKRGLGSGFFVDLKAGYIVSNNHVVDKAKEIYVKLANDQTYQAKIVGRDSKTDIAVLQIRDRRFNRQGLGELELGNSDQPRVGEFVLALGAPYGLQASLSFGVLSASNRGNLKILPLGNFLQTDAAINPGNSGGPLLNMKGQAIGMNTAIFSRSGSSAGIGFAVPSNVIREIANQLITHGKARRGFLGVKTQSLDQDMIAGLELPPTISGAIISDVQEGTPAEKAGMVSGDIVTRINGKEIETSEEFIIMIGLKPPGAQINLEIFRNGKAKEVPVVLEEYPSLDDVKSEPKTAENDKSFSGIKLKPVGSGFFEIRYKTQYGYKSTAGLLVVEVEEQSIFDQTGIVEGDVIVKANNKDVTDVEALQAIYEKSSRIVFKIERKGEFLYAPLRK